MPLNLSRHGVDSILVSSRSSHFFAELSLSFSLALHSWVEQQL